MGPKIRGGKRQAPFWGISPVGWGKLKITFKTPLHNKKIHLPPPQTPPFGQKNFLENQVFFKHQKSPRQKPQEFLRFPN